MAQWFKLRAPMLALLLTILGLLLNTYGRLAAVEQELKDNEVRQLMMEQTLGRIETRLMVTR